MALFTIRYSKAATRALMRMPRNNAELIRGKVRDLADEPRARHANVSKLKGRDQFRLRVEDWRVLFLIDNAAETIRVRLMAPRGSAYE